MTPKKARTYSHYTREAISLLGKYVQLGRKERRFSERDLAARIGISRATLQKIEKGDPRCEIGIVLEAAVLVGVKLFEVEAPHAAAGFSAKRSLVDAQIALLPKSIHKKKSRELDDAF